MNEKKLKVADFASLIGCSQKTVYRLIDTNQLKTVNDVQNGRSITLIVTNNKQIDEFLKIYGNLPSDDVECKEILTDNEIKENNKNAQTLNTIDLLTEITKNYTDKLLTYNDKLFAYNEELITYKSKTLLLEDKASREGLYLNEINQLKSANKKLLTSIIVILSFVFLTLLTVIIYLSINLVKVNNDAVIDRQLPVNEVVNEVKQVKK